MRLEISTAATGGPSRSVDADYDMAPRYFSLLAASARALSGNARTHWTVHVILVNENVELVSLGLGAPRVRLACGGTASPRGRAHVAPRAGEGGRGEGAVGARG